MQPVNVYPWVFWKEMYCHQWLAFLL